ncbi:hypothetical protein D3C76_1707130 [compost metagenome]
MSNDKKPQIRYKAAAFEPDALAPFGASSPSGLARIAKIDPSQVLRGLAGDVQPGSATIAAILDATGKPFEHFFEIV